jgi:hypothetical protein
MAVVPMQAVAATQLTEQQLRAVLGVRAAYINNAVVLARRRPALVHQLQASPAGCSRPRLLALPSCGQDVVSKPCRWPC